MYFLQGVTYFVVACVIIFQIVRHRNATGRAVDSEEITSYVITNDLISNIVEWLLKFRHSKFSALHNQCTCSFACRLHITAIGDQNSAALHVADKLGATYPLISVGCAYGDDVSARVYRLRQHLLVRLVLEARRVTIACDGDEHLLLCASNRITTIHGIHGQLKEQQDY